LICSIVEFHGTLIFDSSKPDGTPRKLADINKLNGLGWLNVRNLKTGIEQTYREALAQQVL
jgi:GDP-L-fucose synthase